MKNRFISKIFNSKNPSVRNLFVNSDANGIFVDVPMRLAVELENTPKSGGWKFDFIVDGDLIGTIGANLNGSVSLFQSFIPKMEGTHTFKGVFYNGNKSVSRELKFEVTRS